MDHAEEGHRNAYYDATTTIYDDTFVFGRAKVAPTPLQRKPMESKGNTAMQCNAKARPSEANQGIAMQSKANQGNARLPTEREAHASPAPSNE